jgi:hypothetical protein
VCLCVACKVVIVLQSFHFCLLKLFKCKSRKNLNLHVWVSLGLNLMGRSLKIIRKNLFCVGVAHFGTHLILINRVHQYFW